MLYVLFGIGIILIVCGALFTTDSNAKFTFRFLGIAISVIILISWLIVIGCYNSTKTTADRQIVVLEERNELVVKQIEPLVDKYLDYEGNTYKDLKLDANIIVSMANYPQLKGDEFVQSQIKIILDNQKQITDLKLKKAKLNAYKLWIFIGE